MYVEAIGVLAGQSELNAGDCFFFDDRGRTIFAICTKEGEGRHKAAVVFSREGGDRLPWIATGGLPHTVLRTQILQIRTDPSSLAFGNSLPLGHVIVAGGAFYIAAAFRKIDTVTINLSTGITEELPLTGVFVSFSRWSAGIVDGDRWIPVFNFPLPENH
ncbi:hypothetical protein [Bradyrhizobium zhanjiangense]|uniref:Uncharacterized protein n=1 Tax=Bradyrhizobium zhanjiangense TaxID=1325107 RepID=A0ABY0DQC2_9BRAD|nr:hypothetical protein [Bradyrhizobium zhanjiangense]RXG96365.1 hypothetical protein EAS62_12295 [Bradyrhizobium zhanjiangense]